MSDILNTENETRKHIQDVTNLLIQNSLTMELMAWICLILSKCFLIGGRQQNVMQMEIFRKAYPITKIGFQ